MALSAFELKNFTIHHPITSLASAAAAAEEDDSMVIELDEHPVSGEKFIKKLAMTSANPENENVWKNATNVAYNAAYDHITGTIYTLGAIVDNVQTYIERTFCMSLSGDPAARASYLHVYVSAPVGGGGGDPEDGSWTGDTN